MRGLGNHSKRRRVKDALSELHPDFIGFQESKFCVIDSCIIAQLIGLSNFGFAFSLSSEQAGDFICCWNLACFPEESRVC